VRSDAPLEDRWIVAEFHSAASKANQALENYRFDDAANEIYQFFWGSFCDWYLEIVKLRLDFSEAAGTDRIQPALKTLLSVFEGSLRLLSPFMPFITEEIWHALYNSNPPERSIALMHYPHGSSAENSPVPTEKNSPQVLMQVIQTTTSTARTLLVEINAGKKDKVPLIVQLANPNLGSPEREAIEKNKLLIETLARSGPLSIVSPLPIGLPRRPIPWGDIAADYHPTLDIPAERDRLTKDIAKYEKGLAAAERQLGNEAFLQKAPPQVVEGLKKQEAETRLLLEKARAALANLPSSGA